MQTNRVLCVWGMILWAVALPAMASDEPPAAATSPASQPQALRISGLPAAEWLHAAAPVLADNLRGRLWVLAVLEPWSADSREQAGLVGDLACVWAPRGVTFVAVTVEPAEQVRAEVDLKRVGLPIGTGSILPLLLPLEPLPKVYLVGPEQTVLWSGHFGELGRRLQRHLDTVASQGLASDRANELSNLLSRGQAALEARQYFLATGLASLVAEAAPTNHPLHEQAGQLLAKLDQVARGVLAESEQMIRERRYAEAYGRLQSVAEEFDNTPAAEQAQRRIDELQTNNRQWAAVVQARDTESAARALELARQATTDERHVEARRYYQRILEVYPRTPAAADARRALREMGRDKALATQLARQQAEPAAPVLLNLAARYAQIGRAEQARQYYQRVLERAPNTPYAEQARQGLEGLPAAPRE